MVKLVNNDGMIIGNHRETTDHSDLWKLMME